MIDQWVVVVLMSVVAALVTKKAIGSLTLSLGKKGRFAVEASGTGAVFALVLIFGAYAMGLNEPQPSVELETPVHDEDSTIPEHQHERPSTSIHTEGDRSPAVVGGGDVTITN